MMKIYSLYSRLFCIISEVSQSNEALTCRADKFILRSYYIEAKPVIKNGRNADKLN